MGYQKELLYVILKIRLEIVALLHVLVVVMLLLFNMMKIKELHVFVFLLVVKKVLKVYVVRKLVLFLEEEELINLFLKQVMLIINIVLRGTAGLRFVVLLRILSNIPMVVVIINILVNLVLLAVNDLLVGRLVSLLRGELVDYVELKRLLKIKIK